MIGKILSGIFNLVIGLVSILLSPIDTLITNTLPSLDSALTSFNSLIDYIITIIGYVVDASGLSDISIALIVGYYTFVIGGTFSVSVVKLALNWYEKLKP